MNKVKFVLFAAGISLALGFVFGCSSGDESENSGGNGSLSSSSNDRDNHSSNSVAGISSSGGGYSSDGGNSSGDSSLSSSSNVGDNHSSSSSGNRSSSSSNGGSGSSSSSNLSSSSSLGQSSSAVLHECDAIFNPDNKFCYDGVVYDKCGGNTYNPVTQGCLSNKTGGIVGEKCGSNLYIQATQGCCGSSVYSQAAEFCYDNRIYDKCDGMTYNPTTHICQYKVATPAKCGSESYNPVTQGCCNGTVFSQTTQYCLASEIVDTKCGNAWYSQTTQFCVDNRVYAKCGGNSYDPVTQDCCNGIVYSRVTHVCKNNMVCGPTDPTIDSRDGKEYKVTVIGTQTWMAENLNYDASGICYSNNETNCATYGRLYGWAMAMDLPTTCNSSLCASQIDTKHQGICPSGWHLPSRAEWNVLMKFVNPSCSDNVGRICDDAGTYLKATSGWDYNNYGSDRYAFSALPGGKNQDVIKFFDVGKYGYWWSSSEYSSNSAFIWSTDGRDAYTDGKSKSYELYSVRCLKD